VSDSSTLSIRGNDRDAVPGGQDLIKRPKPRRIYSVIIGEKNIHSRYAVFRNPQSSAQAWFTTTFNFNLCL
jgi:hypothetical protein